MPDNPNMILNVMMTVLKSFVGSDTINIGSSSTSIPNALFSGYTDSGKNVQNIIDKIERDRTMLPMAKVAQETNNKWLNKFYINVLGKSSEEAKKLIAGDSLINSALNWVIDRRKSDVLDSFARALKFKGVISPFTGGALTNNNRISAVAKNLITNVFSDSNEQAFGQLDPIEIGKSIANNFATGQFNSLINNPNAFVSVKNPDGSVGFDLKQGYKKGLQTRITQIVTYDRLIDSVMPTTKMLTNLDSKKALFNKFMGSDALNKLGYNHIISLLKDVKATSDMYGDKPAETLGFLAESYKAKGINPLNAILDYNTFISTRQLGINKVNSLEEARQFTDSLVNQMIKTKHNPIMDAMGSSYSALYDVYGSKATDMISKVQKEYDMNLKANPRLASATGEAKKNFIFKTVNQYLSPKDQITNNNSSNYNYTTASNFYKNRIFDQHRALNDVNKNVSTSLLNTLKNTSNSGLSYADQVLLRTKGVNSSSLNEILKNKSFRTARSKRDFVSNIKNILSLSVQEQGFKTFKDFNNFDKVVKSKYYSNVPKVLQTRRDFLDKTFNTGKRSFLNAIVDPGASIGSFWNKLKGGELNMKGVLGSNIFNRIADSAVDVTTPLNKLKNKIKLNGQTLSNKN